jgi:hypothetical protein
MWYDQSKTFDRLIIFSPTLSREHKGATFLKAKHYYEITHYKQYNDTIMREERLKMIGDIEEWKDFIKKKEAWKHFLSCKKVEELSHDELVLLEDMEFKKPVWKYEVEQYPCFAMLIDDHVGKKGVFGANCTGFLSEVCVEHRHISLSIYLLSQVFANFIPKQFRGGIINLWILFSTKSQKHKESIAEQVANKVDEDTFVQLWDYATKDDPHDALVVDYKASEVKYMFRKNFDHLIQFENDEIKTNPINK